MVHIHCFEEVFRDETAKGFIVVLLIRHQKVFCHPFDIFRFYLVYY